MWLVLCDPGDLAGMWAYAGLRRRGLAPLELLSPGDLLFSARSVHRVDESGASFEVDLPDGRVLASRDVDGVLNRAGYARVGALAFATEADAGYAREELGALLLSLLGCLAPVAVNRPCATGLSGAWRPPAEWTVLAARAGLPAAPVRLSNRSEREPPPPGPDEGRVLVLGEQVFGARVPDEYAQACVRLARLAGTDLLGIDLRRDGGHRTVFGGADPMPDLRLGGDAFLDRLLDRLTALPAAFR
ncbi:hypothetical protein P3T27_005456 [Kitasatospora sp. MAA19]|uniref:hypothetical protein n=1 Tax=unclassified Kitasatospora TaxID=2633591 RepID=UPI0024750ED7|nr:hypothetical protein [Kitasatospora sp. MAA19]MDH6708710.1 hypothetical protein [Kitasatospora sp. MAA19]